MGVKSFIKKSVAFVSALAMACSMVVMPAGASYAAETGTTDSNPNLVLDKNAKLQSDGTYTVTLEAYAKGRVETTPAVMKPCDIVLVLDQSGSMQWDFSGSDSNYANSRQKALRDAATNFIENVSKNAREQKVDHKMAIVTFGSSASLKSNFVSLYNESDANQNTTGEASLKNTITGLGQSPSGATQTDLGMKEANNLIKSEDISRNRVVVVFTDGYPTSSDGFEINVADSAISYAKQLKDKKAKVYTIGIFGGANVSQVSGTNSDEVGQSWKFAGWFSDYTEGQDAAANRFLNYLSSNFNSATSLGLKYSSNWDGYYYQITTKYARDAKKYYMTASSTTELNNIFEKLSDEVSQGKTDITLDDTAVAKDVMSENFDLPANISNNVKVYTANYEGKDSNGNLKWSDKELFNNAKVTSNSEEKSISVSGFNYGANYIVDGEGTVATSGKKLIIVISGVTANKAGSNMDTNSSSSAIYDKDGGLVKAFRQPKQTIESKSYVLDYGKTVSTAAADYGVTSVAKANVGKPAPNGQLAGEYGTFAISNGALNYTPGKINWDGIDTGYVFGEKDAKTIAAETEEEKSGKDYSVYKWEEVNFIPATSVYYEDDFNANIKTSDTGAKIVYVGTWTVDGTKQDSSEQSSANSQYGWDSSYADDTNYTDGTANKTSTSGSTATFKFTGTGVDIYSRTDLTTGKVMATLTSDGATAASKFMIIDNKAASGTYYQVPTLFFENLEYGTYEVKIQVLDAVQDGETSRGTYYLDGIRVYNPLGATLSETVKGAYDAAVETNALFTSVRKVLLDSKTFSGDQTTAGAVFIDQISKDDTTGTTTSDIGTYEKLGPKNEVYLAKGQAVAFKINTPYTGKVFIGAKSLTGQETEMKVTDSVTAEKAKSVKFKHTSDMYYEVNPTSEGYVVIQNLGDSVLAITKLRLTGVSTATNEIQLQSDASLMSYASEFALLKAADTDEKGMVLEKDTPDVDIDNPDSSDDKEDETSSSNTIWNSILDSILKWFGRK